MNAVQYENSHDAVPNCAHPTGGHMLKMGALFFGASASVPQWANFSLL